MTTINAITTAISKGAPNLTRAGIGAAGAAALKYAPDAFYSVGMQAVAESPVRAFCASMFGSLTTAFKDMTIPVIGAGLNLSNVGALLAGGYALENLAGLAMKNGRGPIQTACQSIAKLFSSGANKASQAAAKLRLAA